MTTIWLVAGALACAVSIIAGAFGAHGLEARLDADHLALWETAARYLMYGGLGVLLFAALMLQQERPGYSLACALLLGGCVIFSGTIFAIAIGGPTWLGAITPLGGLGMIAGFVFFAFAAWRG